MYMLYSPYVMGLQSDCCQHTTHACHLHIHSLLANVSLCIRDQQPTCTNNASHI